VHRLFAQIAMSVVLIGGTVLIFLVFALHIAKHVKTLYRMHQRNTMTKVGAPTLVDLS
jgi:hypothetical protein